MRNTKSLIFKRNFFFVLSILSIYLPIIVFFFIGFNNSTTTEKLALSSTAIAAIILALLSIFKYKSLLKVVVWVILIGLVTVISNMSVVIIICGIFDIIGELIFLPLYNYYKRIANESANNDDASEKIARAIRR